MVTCCVVQCQRNTNKDRGMVKFFRFPARNLEQRLLWITAVKRKGVEGKSWQPSKFTRICSDHFTGGIYSPTRNHPSYVPSIFPTQHVKSKKINDVIRFDRALNRQKNNRVQKKEDQINDRRKDIQTQTYTEQVINGLEHDVQIIERHDSNNVSVQIDINPKPTTRAPGTTAL